MSSARSVLGDDEIEEILLRLPAIDLVCYKAVCKDWRSLISSAEFVSAHLKRSRSNPSSHFLVVHTNPNRAPRGSFQSINSYCSECMVMVGSVNGLICMVGNPLPSQRDIGIFIWNPITGLSTELPSPSTPSTLSGVVINKFTFWCDDSDGGVYKVAKLFREYYGSITVEVWVSRFPHTWITVTTADLDLNCHGWVSGPQVLIEGLAAYWTATNAGSVNIFVMMLDLKTLTLEAIPLSEVEACLPADEYGYSLLSGVNFKGEFVLMQRTSSSDEEGIYDIWTMGMDARRSWKKSSTFRLDYPFLQCLGSVNGKLLVLQRSGHGITLYDMETRMHDVLGKYSNPFLRNSAHGFVGSLVSIEGFETSDLCAGISWPSSFAPGRVLKMQMQPPPPPYMHPPWGQMQMHIPPPPH